MRRQPLAGVALAAVIAILAIDQFPAAPAGTMLILALIAGALAAWRQDYPAILLLTTAAYAAAHSVALYETRSFPFHRNLENRESIRIAGEGLVVSPPGSGDDLRRSHFVARIDSINLAGHRWRMRHRIPVRLEKFAEIRYGDRIRFTGLLQPLEPQQSPGAFAADEFFRRTTGSIGDIRIGPGDPIEVIASDRGNRLIAASIRSRDWISRTLTRGLEPTPDLASIIRAMVLGTREDTPDDIEESFRLTGAMHIFAVSGLHVGIFGGIVWFVLKMLGVPRRYAIAVIIPAILFYALVTGLRPSAIRAAVMGSVLLFSYAVYRQPRLINSLAFAALLLLAFDTRQLFQPGFQLSFLVLFSIALLADPLRNWFHRPLRIDPFLPRRFASPWRRSADLFATRLCSGLGVSLAAWIGSCWLIIHYFQIFTPISIVANLVMVPLAGLVLSLGAASIAAGALQFGGLTVFFNHANAGIARLLTVVAAQFASLPAGHHHVSPAVFFAPSQARLSVLETNMQSMAVLFSTAGTPAVQPAHWLIDPGNTIGYRSRLQPMLRHYAVNELQAVILSHGDAAHIASVPTVLRRYPAGAVFESPFEKRSSSADRIADAAEIRRVPRAFLARGDRIPIDAHSRIEVLFPPRDLDPPSLADDRCLVIRLHHHRWRFLLTFDSGFLTEKWLIEHEPDLRADVWIRGRHGSDLSGLTEFTDRVRPSVVITSNEPFPQRESITDEQKRVLDARRIRLIDLTAVGAVTILPEKEKVTLTPFLYPKAAIVLDSP